MLYTSVSEGAGPADQGSLTVGRMQPSDLVHHQELKQEQASRNIQLLLFLNPSFLSAVTCFCVALRCYWVHTHTHTHVHTQLKPCLGNFCYILSKLWNSCNRKLLMRANIQKFCLQLDRYDNTSRSKPRSPYEAVTSVSIYIFPYLHVNL